LKLLAEIVDYHPRACHLRFLVKIAKGQMQIPFGKLRAGFRLTTPKLKSVWGPFRSDGMKRGVPS
jgi:hypothetical protein